MPNTKEKLIDANAFRDYWNKNYRHQYANDTFLFALANFPTVDAVEVVHGNWLDVFTGFNFFAATCSVCHKRSDLPPIAVAKYCPRCGAKMDGGNEDA